MSSSSADTLGASLSPIFAPVAVYFFLQSAASSSRLTPCRSVDAVLVVGRHAMGAVPYLVLAVPHLALVLRESLDLDAFALVAVVVLGALAFLVAVVPRVLHNLEEDLARRRSGFAAVLVINGSLLVIPVFTLASLDHPLQEGFVVCGHGVRQHYQSPVSVPPFGLVAVDDVGVATSLLPLPPTGTSKFKTTPYY